MVENIRIQGFQGPGNIEIDFQNTTNTLNGTVSVENCTNAITITDGKFNFANEENTHGIFRVKNSLYLRLTRCECYLRDATWSVVNAEGPSFIEAYQVESYDAVNYAYAASRGAVINVWDCVGTGAGAVSASYGGVVSGRGTRPGGIVSVTYGGRYDSSLHTANTGASVPPPTPETRKLYTSTGSRSWDDRYGWDESDVIQGEWSSYGNHRGLWFFDDAQIRADLAGKTIKSVRLYMSRLSQGGYSGAGTPTVWNHNYASQPAGTPLLSNGTASHGTSFAWGEAKWVELGPYWGEKFRDGTAKGIALYAAGTSPYLKFDPASQLEIVYQ
jgi:hypothetical protein